MAWQDFKLIGFAPDLPVTTPGYLTATYNAVPTDRGFGAGPRLVLGSSSGVNTQSLGGALVSKTDATQELIVGTATKLYGFDLSTTLTDRSGAAYSASTTDTWSVSNFGNIALAVNHNDFLQQRTIGAGANFAAVGAAPVPKASIVVTCGPTSAPFVMVFDYNDGTNNDRDGWKCSAISDYTGWTAGTNSSATGRLLDNSSGPITAAVPYRDGVVAWKRGSMYVGSYTGPPNIWSWQRISADVGCIGKNACIEANDAIYFADDSGVWIYDGSYPRPIPGYVQKYWTDLVALAAPGAADRNYYKVIWDKPKHLIYFKTGNSTNGTGLGGGLLFNTVSGLWGSLAVAGSGGVTELEIIAPRYVVVTTSLKVSTITWGAGAGEPISATLTGWVISDRVNHPKIKGIRPNWSIGPTTATNNWFGGNVYVQPTERSVQPVSRGAQTALFVGTFRQPGKLDLVGSGEILTFDVTPIAGIDWEIAGTISLDLENAGRS